MAVGNFTLPSAPYPFFDNATSLFNLVKYVNIDLTGGIFAYFLIISLGIVVFSALKRNGFSTPKSLAATFWLVDITIILMYFGQLITGDLGTGFLVFAVISLAATPFIIKGSETSFE